ncbi:hypothetical protein [Pseudoalteromonas peptidolytica]|uniref:Uncharacterized protein n=1 Tax=Pseudoalteromonas peptidolytica F12-50-A1 TaxID=1315280 RepID=A0A8I0T351_9GAMM|nr:hypothetical protein [Pseudoalteromonas peptidolytica]MBE0346006.1 hypothetical protein [Pseudoalteromonas peptidolytica F12-50-A1]GEK10931.1 hypothetical protein PPE03_31800 [Pseudoalteromonas peptidolytica]
MCELVTRGRELEKQGSITIASALYFVRVRISTIQISGIKKDALGASISSGGVL